MNKIFRVIWNASLRRMVVAGELAKRYKRGSGVLVRCAAAVTAGVLACASPTALADGRGGSNAAALGGNGASGGAGGGGGTNGIGGTGSGSVSAGQNGANGNGGAGSVGGATSGGSPGTPGGGGSVGSAGNPVGGNGGNGGDAICGACTAGLGASGGGGGGDGLNGSTLDGVIGPIIGGNGGNGGSAQSASVSGADGGSGGGAGAGAVITGSGSTSSSANITGGRGGDGGNPLGPGGAGFGGGGGSGLVDTGVSLSNTFAIRGGDGGNGGNGAQATHGRSGGAGGAGIIGASLTLNNTGTVQGGNGGTTGLNPNAGTPGAIAVGGAGVQGTGLQIINAGMIAGGLNGNGTVRANAISFTGGVNSLTLLQGWGITGNVVGTGGSTNTLILGGDSTDLVSDPTGLGISTIFDVSRIGTGYTGIGSFQKTGASTWQLLGSTTAVTPWTIAGGTLQMGNDALGGATGALTVLDGGTLATTGSFAMTRATTLGAGTALFDVAPDTSLSMGGVISGAGALNKANAGTLVLTGTNTYGGITTISAGTLQLGAGGTTGAIVGDVINNGTLTFNRSNAYAFAGLISGTGAVSKLAAGVTTLSADNTYLGGTTITAGTLQLGAGGTTGSIVGDVINNGTLSFNRSNANTFAGVISGTGAVTKLAAGTTTLTADNTYTGTTTITGGTLQLGDGGSTGSITGNVVNNAALAFNRSVDITFGGVISGTGTVSQLGNSLLTLTGTNTYSGGTTITGGTVSVGANANLGATTGAVTLDGGTLQATAGFTMARAMTLTANNGTIQTDTGVTLSNSGVISGASGALTKTGAGTLVLTGASTYGGITTLSAGTLQLGAGGTTGAIVGDVVNNGALAFNRSNAYTFAGLISGSGAVEKLAAGTTTLTADNSYTGGTTISAGTLQLGSGGTTGSIVGDVTNNGTLTFNRSDAITFNGVISGTGAVTKLAAGITTLTADNTYAGITTITGGTLQLGDGGTAGSITGNVVNNAILAVNRSNAITLDGVISGTGSVRQIGAGTTTLAGTNTYAGGTAITAGTVSVGANANLGAATGAVTLDGGTLQTTASFATARAMSITPNNGTLQADAGTTLTANGVISGASGGLIKTGDGTLVLTANNTYAGGTTISAGTVSVAANLDLGAAAGGVTLDGGTLAATTGFTTGRAVTITSNNGTIDTAAGTTLLMSGVVSGTDGALFKTGDGTLTLTGENTYASGTTIAAGTLQLGAGATGGSILGDIVNNAALTLNRTTAINLAGAISGTGALNKLSSGVATLTGENTYTGGTTITQGTLRIGDGGTTGSITGNIVNNATLEFNRSNALTYAGAISGTGTLNQTGSGVTSFTGGPSSVGRVNVTGGTLDLAQTGTFTVTDDYTTALGATTRMAAGSTLVVGDVFTQTAGSTLDVELGGAQPAISASTANIGGTLRIAGFNASVPDSASALPGASYNIIHTAAPGGIANDFTTVLMDGSDGTADYLTIAGSKSANAQDYNVGFALTWNAGATLGNGVFTLDDAADTFNIDVVLTNQGASATGWDGTTLTKQGPGTLILSSANTYTGPTLINAGTLRTGADNAFALSSAVSVAGGATLDLDSFNQTANNLTGDGAVTLGTAALTLANSGDTDFGGVISGDGSVDKTGAAALTLTGNSTYTGGTTISQGTLQLGDGGTTGSIVGNVLNDGALVFNRSDDITFAGDISGTGSLTQAGAGTTTLTGSGSYSGGTTISAGAVQLGDGGTTGSISGDVLNNGALLFNRSDDAVFAGTISGTGAVTQVGTGTTTLTADNTYGGGTEILAGTLQLGNGNTSGAIIGDVASNGTLAFNHSDAVVFAGTISGAGAVTQLGSGTTTFTADNTYTGGTTISQGTLQLGDGGTTGSLLGDVINDGALVFNRSNALTYGGAITGVGTLTQAGTGVLTLINAGSSVGNATVAAGTLEFAQAGGFTVTGDYLTAGGATTQIAADATLGVGNVFTQSAGSTLNVAIGSAQPIITAASADIGGTLNITGFTASVPTSASALPGTLFNLISTTNGIANDFSAVTFGSAASPVDYLILAGSKSADQLSYNIGFGLTWLAGVTNGDGSFTLTDPTDSFNVDVVLADQAASSTGWDGTTLTKNGAGTLVLSAANAYTGATLINAGTLRTGIAGAFANSSAVSLASGSTLDLDNFNQTANNLGGAGDITLGSAVLTVNDGLDTSLGGVISGTGSLVKTGAATLTLTGTNTYTGGTTISEGTLQIGDGGTIGSILGDVANAGTLTFNRADAIVFDGVLSGAGVLNQIGAGTTVLTGNSGAFSGSSVVSNGTLQVDGSLGAVTSTLSVNNGGRLAGRGTIGGNVSIADGILAPGASPGTLTINGDLSLAAASILNYEFGQAGVVGGALNDLTVVGGDLTLDGTLNVATASGGSFGPGLYRIIDYAGSLTDNGLVVGTVPLSSYFVQTSVANQVNLVNTDGLTLGYWDGAAGPRNNNIINGGAGLWQSAAGNDNWTTLDGAVNAPFSDAAFAVFSAAPGTVEVDNSLGAVTASGMQFASSGYVLQGDAITLVETDPATPGITTLRVGDGTGAGAGHVATLNTVLSGAVTVEKSDLGTLVLGGENTYSGGTIITAGAVSVSSDANLGAVAGNVTLDGGTLAATAGFTTARTIALTGNNGTLETSAGVTLTANGAIDGAGALTKSGDGILLTTADNTYTGGTTISAGTLQLGNGGTTGSLLGNVTNNATLVFNRSDALDYAGSITGTGRLTQAGTGTVTLTGNNVVGNADVTGGTLTLAQTGAFTVADDYSTATGAATQIGAGATLDIGDQFSQAAGSTLNVSLGAAQPVISAARADLGGTLDVTGFSASVPASASALTSTRRIIIQTTGGITGDFSAATFGGATSPVDYLTVTAGKSLDALDYGIGFGLVWLAGPAEGNGVFTLTGAADTFDVDVLLADQAASATGWDGTTLTKNGAGTLVLSAANTYTGPTLVNAGILRTNIANAFSGSSTVQVAGGATLDLNGFGQVANNLAGAGDVVLGAATLTANSVTDTLFAGGISGSGALAKTGTATLTLTGDGSYTGGTTIADGSLQLGNGGATGSLVGDVANDGTLTFNRSNDLSFTGSITGTGSINQIGAGRTILTADNAYTGGTAIAAGILQLGDGGATGAIVGDVVNNGELVFNRNNALTLAGAITGAGAVTQAGTGTTTLSGIGSSVGSASVTAGTLSLAQTGGFTVAGDYSTASGATTQLAADATLEVGDAFTQAAGSTLTVALGSAQPVISAVSADIGGTLNIAGFSGSAPGSATALPAAQFTVIRTTAGIANDFSAVNLGGAASPVDYLTLAGAKSVSGLDYNVGFGLTWLAGASAGNGVFTLADPVDSFNVDVVLGNQAASATGWDGATLTKNGQGTLLLSAVNTYTGPTLINAGTLRTGADNAFALSSAVSVAGGATLDLDSFNQTANNLSGDGAVTLGTAALTLANSSDTAFGGVISGDGSVDKTGAAALTLTGNSTYTGGTTISQGTLQLGDGGTTGSLAGDIVSDGALVFNRSDALIHAGSITGSGSLTQAGSGTTILTQAGSSVGDVQVTAGTLDLDQAGLFTATGDYTTAAGATTRVGEDTTLSVGGVFTQAAGSALDIEFEGPQPVIVAASAAIGGTLDITGFRATIPSSASALTGTLFNIITTTGGIANDFASVVVDSTASPADYLTLAGGKSADQLNYNVGFGLTWLAGPGLGNGVFTLTDAADSFDVDVVLSNQASSATGWDGTTLTKEGPGTLVLSAANTYTGPTLIRAGTLRAGIIDAFVNSSAVSVESGATLDLDSADQTANLLSGAGNVLLGTATLTAQTAGDITFAGVISGSGDVIKSGASVWTLTGNNLYTGGTTIAAGTLQLGNGGAGGLIAGDVVDNGVLAFNRADAITFAGAISGTGAVRQVGTGTTALTGNSTHAGGTTIVAGTLQLGDGGTTGSITGDVVNDGVLAFNRTDATTFSGVISGAGAVTQLGPGTTALTAANTYLGGTRIADGTLQLGDGGTTGSISGDVIDNGTLAFNRSDAITFAGLIQGTGGVAQVGTGTTTLTADNTYGGITTISAGTLQIGNGGNTGSITGDVVDNGILVFDRAGSFLFGGALSGAGSFFQVGSGTTQMTGNSSAFAGATNITGGTLQVDGVLGSATSTLTVVSGGRLSGTGTVGGDAAIVDGILAPGASPGTLTIGGDLTLGPGAVLDYEFGQAGVVGGAFNDLTVVGGDLTLDGVINVSASSGGVFGPGLYRILSYGGTLTDNGLAISTVPAGSDTFVHTGLVGQVNLVNTAGLTLDYWDGEIGRFNGQIDGGSGLWQNAGGNLNWTEANGDINAGYADGGFAIFAGTPGTVTVDTSLGPVTTSGMQFAVTGYRIEGDPLTLATGSNVVRVGDGTAPGQGYVATIASVLDGAGGLDKADLGTLVLTGANSYTGGTTISAGTLQLGDGSTTGSIIGDVTDNGTLAFNNPGTTVFAGTISGTGSVHQTGGTTVLTADSTYTGGTTLSNGSLNIGDGGTSGSIVGNVVDNAALVFNRSDAITFAGAISGSGVVVQLGSGITTLSAANTYTGGTTIAAGALHIGDGGTSGSIVGNVTNTGELVFNRSDALTYAGTLSGAGTLTQMGAGTTTLTGAGSSAGSTQVTAGTLSLAQAGAFNVAQNYRTASGAATQLAAGSTLVVGDVFSQAAGSSLTVALGGTQPLIAAGSAEIAGALNVTGFSASLPATASALTGTQFNLIHATGGITGDFSTVAFGGASSAVDYLTLAGSKASNQLDYNVGLGLTWLAGAAAGNGVFTLQEPPATFTVDVVLADQAAAATGWDGTTLTKMGAGTLVLSAANTYTGPTQINAGVLQAGTVGAFVDSSAVHVEAGATLYLNNYDQTANNLTGAGTVMLGSAALTANNTADTAFAGTIEGAGSVIKTGPVALVLTGANTYAGGTTINAGTLQLGDGGTTGSIVGDVTANGTLAFNRADAVTFAGVISGSGTVSQIGSGITRLTGDSATFGGSTSVTQGTLQVNGTLGASTSTLVAATGGTLGGTGTLGGAVALQDGILAPGASVGTLTIGGPLSLTADSVLDFEFGEAGVVGGQFNDLTVVGGDLILDGTLNVISPPGGAFDPGIYRIIDYSGALTNNGLNLGVLPRSTPFFVQTDFAGQVNLVNTLGLTFEYWDGSGPRFNGVIDGGDGVWQGSAGNDNWTETSAAVNGPFADGAFAVFGGQAGTVTVDNSVGAVTTAGMQFATDGYRIQGDPISLLAGDNVIRVGDGTQSTTGFTATIDAVLTGAGGVDKADVGTLILTGTNTYTGGTIIDEGVLQIGSGGSSGSLVGPVVNNAVLAFNRSDAVTFAGDISGAGTVLQTGTGATTLTGANSYDGGTHVASGTLIGSASSFGSGAVLNDAALVLDQANDAVFSNPLTGAGSLTKTGAGKLDFRSDSALSGPTTVAAGVLAVNGSLAGSRLDVLGGASLAGTGAVGATVIQPGGTIAPGNSIGTLSIAGDFSQAAGATYQVEVDPGSTASDLIRVSGTATLASGAALNVAKVNAGEYSLNSRYTVLTATHGVQGTYTLGGDVTGAFFRLEDTYDAGNVYLTPVQVRSFLDAGMTPNEIAAAGGLQTLPDGHPLKDAVGLLATDREARDAFNQLSGEIHASTRTQLIQDSRFAREAVADRLYSSFCVIGSAGRSERGPAASEPGDASCNPEQAVGWTRVFGAWGRTDGDGNAARLERSTGGLFVGTDIPVSDAWRVGALLGYSRASLDVDDRASSADSRDYHLGVYAGSRSGNLGVRLGAVHALHTVDTRRQVGFANVSELLEAGYGGETTQVFGELGYGIARQSLQIEPFAAVAYVRQSTDAFTERGGVAALTGDAERSSTTFSTLGVRLATQFELGETQWRTRATVGWRHAFNDDIPRKAMAFSASPPFGIQGVPIAGDVAIIEAGVEASLARNAVLSATYVGQFGDGMRDNGIDVRLSWRF